jgi:hypothetical protein
MKTVLDICSSEPTEEILKPDSLISGFFLGEKYASSGNLGDWPNPSPGALAPISS